MTAPDHYPPIVVVIVVTWINDLQHDYYYDVIYAYDYVIADRWRMSYYVGDGGTNGC